MTPWRDCLVRRHFQSHPNSAPTYLRFSRPLSLPLPRKTPSPKGHLNAGERQKHPQMFFHGKSPISRGFQERSTLITDTLLLFWIFAQFTLYLPRSSSREGWTGSLNLTDLHFMVLKLVENGKNSVK